MKLIREFDDFEWAKNDLINPWILGYTGIHFDIEPTRENLNQLIEMALSTDITNVPKWGEDERETDIDNLLKYFNEGESYLGISKYLELGYGTKKDYIGWGGIKWIGYSKLIDNGLNENKEDDDFDWIREVPTGVPFEQAVIGRKYRIETTEVLMGALEACDELEWLYNSTEAEVIDSGTKGYDTIFCEHESMDEVFTLKLKFYYSSSNHSQSRTFWVTEDMVTLYPII